MNSKKQKVFVGLSGGVDSSVSAALLKKAGYDVVGVFIKTWHPDFLPCTWRKDRLDAMRVAAHLGISFQTLDLEKEYKENVADYMIEEYRKGRTPNPDVMCNKYVKFGAFLEFAKKSGADCIATGHYAKRLQRKDGTYEMHMGQDKNKDQTYFLWMLGQKELKHILFPIGHLEKTEVRKLAEQFHLPTAQKKDSQGVCFLGALDMQEFLSEFIEQEKGDVLDEKGHQIGVHDGAVFYTLGQRHGFTITQKSINDAPYYVCSKDMTKNTITVSRQQELSEKEGGQFKVACLEEVSWVSAIPPEKEKGYQVRFRYRQPVSNARLSFEGVQTKVIFDHPTERFAAGQSLVVYDGDVCLGGGVLSR